MDMDFAVSRPLIPCSRLISGICPSTRTFAPRFLQTSPRGDSPCVITSPSPPSGWAEDSHLRAAEHAQHTTKPLRGSLKYAIERCPNCGAALKALPDLVSVTPGQPGPSFMLRSFA